MTGERGLADRPPRLWVGGGSDRLLGLAGRFADLLDLHGDPEARARGRRDDDAGVRGDVARRAHTTVDDLAGRIGLVRDAAEAPAALGMPWACRPIRRSDHLHPHPSGVR